MSSAGFFGFFAGDSGIFAFRKAMRSSTVRNERFSICQDSYFRTSGTEVRRRCVTATNARPCASNENAMGFSSSGSSAHTSTRSPGATAKFFIAFSAVSFAALAFGVRSSLFFGVVGVSTSSAEKAMTVLSSSERK